MQLLNMIQRVPQPEPWSEGDNIPWNDPAFSARMLKEHLSQAHDAASRRAAIIDRQVQWIHAHILQHQPARILDLGCGPGLYARRFAALGHTCTGIDFSPASIDYARRQAAGNHLNCAYTLADLRQADYGTGHDLAMLIFGELNVFRPDDARLILRKVCAALKPGGVLLLEPHTFDAVRELGQEAASWYTTASGLFSEQPHLVLTEHFWDADTRTATTRYFIVDAASGTVTRHASTMQAYTDDDYRALLTDCGFDRVAFYPALVDGGDFQSALQVITARSQTA